MPLWRERIYCKGKHGCNPNPSAVNVRHRHCSVEIICVIWSHSPTFMDIKYQGSHGPHHKPKAEKEKMKAGLSYGMTQFIKEQMAVNPTVTPAQLHIALTTTYKDKFAKSKMVCSENGACHTYCYIRPQHWLKLSIKLNTTENRVLSTHPTAANCMNF